MKKCILILLISVVYISSLISCGGMGSDSYDDGGDASISGDELTSSEINAISSALTAATNAVSDAMAEGAQNDTTTSKATRTFNISAESECPLDGHITCSGNISVSVNEDTGDSSAYGQIMFQVSDPTNNLNDCEVADDIILDGTLYLTISGVNSDFTMTLDGTIGINSRGQTGGLVPIADDCRIFITYSDGGAYGTICGHAVTS